MTLAAKRGCHSGKADTATSGMSLLPGALGLCQSPAPACYVCGLHRKTERGGNGCDLLIGQAGRDRLLGVGSARRYPKFLKVVYGFVRGEAGVGAAKGFRNGLHEAGEAVDVEFIDAGAMPGSARGLVAAPVEAPGAISPVSRRKIT